MFENRVSKDNDSFYYTIRQLKTTKFVQRPIKSLYLTPDSRLMVPRRIPTSRSLERRKFFQHLFSNLTSGKVSKRCHFSLEFFSGAPATQGAAKRSPISIYGNKGNPWNDFLMLSWPAVFLYTRFATNSNIYRPRWVTTMVLLHFLL